MAKVGRSERKVNVVGRGPDEVMKTSFVDNQIHSMPRTNMEIDVPVLGVPSRIRRE